MTTKAQTKKEDIIAEFQKTRASILETIASLPLEKLRVVFLGTWSVEDLVAHLAGWDYTNISAVNELMASTLPSFYKHHDRDWQTYNAILVAKHKHETSEDLLRAVKDSHHQLIAFLQTVPPESFSNDYGVRFRGYKVTIQRLLESEIKDEQIHCQQIKDFFKATK